MHKLSTFAAACGIATLATGCAVSSSSSETGHNIQEDSIAHIRDGHTTLTQVINLFGTPSKTSRAGANDLYTYLHCVSDGSSVAIAGAGNTSRKEHCESLTVAVDRETGVVTSHSFKDELDD